MIFGAKYLVVLMLPLLVSCSSSNGLLKRSVALHSDQKPTTQVDRKTSHSDDAEDGAFHIVGSGETLQHICDVYGLDLDKVAKMNQIKPPFTLRNGETIFLPATALLNDQSLKNRYSSSSFDKPAGSTGKKSMTADLGRPLSGIRNPAVPELLFPVTNGTVSSPFGYRWGKFHKGLDIAAPIGSPVVACAEGRVLFVGSRKGFRRYGNTVLLDHGRGVYTYYAHLNEITVKKNQKVRRGQKIASVGNTGRSTGPHLHLEVRVINTMYNPLAYFSPSDLTGTRLAKRFTNSPMGPVRARWEIPDLLAAHP